MTHRRISITRKEIIDTLIQDHRFTKNEASRFYNDFTEIIIDYLMQNHSITLRGLGHFEVAKTKPHRMHDAHTGKIEIEPAKYRLTFSASRKLNRKINNYYTRIEKHPY